MDPKHIDAAITTIELLVGLLQREHLSDAQRARVQAVIADYDERIKRAEAAAGDGAASAS